MLSSVRALRQRSLSPLKSVRGGSSFRACSVPVRKKGEGLAADMKHFTLSRDAEIQRIVLAELQKVESKVLESRAQCEALALELKVFAERQSAMKEEMVETSELEELKEELEEWTTRELEQAKDWTTGELDEAKDEIEEAHRELAKKYDEDMKRFIEEKDAKQKQSIEAKEKVQVERGDAMEGRCHATIAAVEARLAAALEKTKERNADLAEEARTNLTLAKTMKDEICKRMDFVEFKVGTSSKTPITEDMLGLKEGLERLNKRCNFFEFMLGTSSEKAMVADVKQLSSRMAAYGEDIRYCQADKEEILRKALLAEEKTTERLDAIKESHSSTVDALRDDIKAMRDQIRKLEDASQERDRLLAKPLTFKEILKSIRAKAGLSRSENIETTK